MGDLEVLRRLKYVYLFLREAEKREFREAQDRAASSWVNSALDSRLVHQNTSTPKLRAYINSELGVALYVDMTVLKGEDRGARIARAAIGEVRKVVPNVGDWTKVQEGMVINIIKTLYNEPVRVSRIENITPRLSPERGAFPST